MKKFSEEFKKIIADPVSFEKMISEYNCTSGDYKEWEDKRRFIARAINDNGTILDIGCAGGFLLRSLQEWSEYELIPYGIDINGSAIEQSKRLFPAIKDHFLEMDLRNLAQLPSFGFPEQYDFIYLSTGDDVDILDSQWSDFIKTVILPMTQKRLILGFYGTNAFPFESQKWKEERERIEQILENLKKTGLSISGTEINPTQFNQAIAWIDIS